MAPLHEHEAKVPYFEGCLPIEVLAARGPKTLSFGPMKPVGLTDPRTGRRPWACLQLRQENRAATLYSMVGFQTRMKWGDQKRVFRLIPGLENAEFVRYGVIHRNTYIQSPQVLNRRACKCGHTQTFSLPARSPAWKAMLSRRRRAFWLAATPRVISLGQPLLTLPDTTMLGALVHYVAHYDGKDFQPMNSNWGIVPPLPDRIRDKKEKNRLLAERGLAALEAFLAT